MALHIGGIIRQRCWKINSQSNKIKMKVAVLTSKVACVLTLLDAGIFARTVRGQLVVQDSADEPAATILVRLGNTSQSDASWRGRRRVKT